MSGFSLMDPEEEPAVRVRTTSAGGRRAKRRKRKKRGPWIPVLVLVVIFAVVGYGGKVGYDQLKARFGPAPDYAGPGSGQVMFEVKQGDSVAQMGRNLRSQNVVRSVDSFIDAARLDPKSSAIQVGFYAMKKRMKSADALAVLVNPNNQIKASVTIPEGFTVKQVVARLAAQTDFSAAQFNKVLADPSAIGIPSYAEDKPEGYLYPATYPVLPNSTPKSILTAMVAQWKAAADDLGLEAGAEKLGYTPQEVMTVASILEQEVNTSSDRFKVSRVIYNRLEGDETNGYLQLDTTVDYGADQSLNAHPTSAEVNSRTGQYATPYNTYINTGLPPGPIDNPSRESIEAALKPADGPWNYYVTVNLDTGETKFSEGYAEFLRNKQEFLDYCDQNRDVCYG